MRDSISCANDCFIPAVKNMLTLKLDTGLSFKLNISIPSSTRIPWLENWAVLLLWVCLNKARVPTSLVQTDNFLLGVKQRTFPKMLNNYTSILLFADSSEFVLATWKTSTKRAFKENPLKRTYWFGQKWLRFSQPRALQCEMSLSGKDRVGPSVCIKPFPDWIYTCFLYFSWRTYPADNTLQWFSGISEWSAPKFIPRKVNFSKFPFAMERTMRYCYRLRNCKRFKPLWYWWRFKAGSVRCPILFNFQRVL